MGSARGDAGLIGEVSGRVTPLNGRGKWIWAGGRAGRFGSIGGVITFVSKYRFAGRFSDSEADWGAGAESRPHRRTPDGGTVA